MTITMTMTMTMDNCAGRCPGQCYCCKFLLSTETRGWPFDWCTKKDDAVGILGRCKEHECKFEKEERENDTD